MGYADLRETITIPVTPIQKTESQEACQARRLTMSVQGSWLIERLLRGEIPWGPPEPQAREQEAERGT